MIYEFICPVCKQVVSVSRPISRCSETEICTKCNTSMDRIYNFQRKREFQPYYDEQYRCEISSYGQEKRLMKQHGHIYAHDLLSRKYEAQSKHAKWKARHPHSVVMK